MDSHSVQNKPTVHAYFLCYNEEFILPHLLKYYSSFCERITLLDNMSTDGSLNVASAFNNVDVLQWESGGEIRDDYYLQLKNNVWKQDRGNYDYVIVGDADEFLYHPNMIDFLTKSKEDGYTVFKPEGYHMIGDEDLALNQDDNILDKVTEGIIGSSNDKCMLFDPNKLQEINYGFGCHQAYPIGDVKMYVSDGDLKMLHYKYLGLSDFIPKQLSRGKRLSEYNKSHGMGMYYLYDENTHKEEYKTFIQRRTKVL